MDYIDYIKKLQDLQIKSITEKSPNIITLITFPEEGFTSISVQEEKDNSYRIKYSATINDDAEDAKRNELNFLSILKSTE